MLGRDGEKCKVLAKDAQSLLREELTACVQ